MSRFNTPKNYIKSRSRSPPRNIKESSTNSTNLINSANLNRLKYNLKPVNFQQPFELGHFSYGKNREFIWDDSALSYLILPGKEETDLSSQYSNRIEKDITVNEHLDGLLKGISKLVERGLNVEDYQFVSYRGMINKINLSYYERNDWSLNLIKYKNLIFIDNGDFEEKLKSNLDQSDKQKLMSYWGYKFENLSTYSKPAEELKEELNRTECIVNTKEEYCSIYKTRVGNYKLILGAEVDCWSDNPNLNKNNPNRLENYIELKTSRIIESEKQAINFEKFKLLKFWSQSFLAGIPEVIVGFRDDEGQLKSVQRFSTLKIPSLVRGKTHAWDPNICLNYLNSILSFIGQSFKDLPNDKELVYKLEFNFNQKSLALRRDPTLASYLPQDFLI